MLKGILSLGKSNKVIQFPRPEYILRCHRCKINAFYIILNSNKWNDIKSFECAECGKFTRFKGGN